MYLLLGLQMKLLQYALVIILIAVLRLGKSLEMLYSAKQALHIKDVIVQACVTLSRIASACFLFLDHIIWLQRAKAININIKPISRLSNQFWLLSTILNIFRNIYDWNRIYDHQRLKTSPMRGSSTYVPETIPTLLDSVKNSFDILIPLHGLDYMYVPGVIQGATGAVSSMIGIATVWNDRLKLVNV